MLVVDVVMWRMPHLGGSKLWRQPHVELEKETLIPEMDCRKPRTDSALSAHRALPKLHSARSRNFGCNFGIGDFQTFGTWIKWCFEKYWTSLRVWDRLRMRRHEPRFWKTPGLVFWFARREGCLGSQSPTASVTALRAEALGIHALSDVVEGYTPTVPLTESEAEGLRFHILSDAAGL
ncbi:hypothetical protein Sjap_024457 [Stephania japonica]|uniref:Uncharacterized protein n=1 Tax=Stephania japonica TaxID=461633 RepID=A0AAP0EFK9_9MAGN